MQKDPLTKKQIGELAGLLLESFEWLQKLKTSHDLGYHIQFPKIPSVLSESIVAHLLKDGRLGVHPPNVFVEAELGGKQADIICTTKDGDKILCEAKTTGNQGFQYFSDKDIRADLLVWVHFGPFFEGVRSTPIMFFILEKPSLVFKQSRKISLAAFKREAGSRLIVHDFRPNEIWLLHDWEGNER